MTLGFSERYATVAQLVEQLTRNEQVVRSNRISSSKKDPITKVTGSFFILHFLWSIVYYLFSSAVIGSLMNNEVAALMNNE